MSNIKIRYFLRVIFLMMFLGIFLFSSTATLQAAVFTVNTTKDTVDTNPGDGVAADSEGNCSLRAAIMEANALAGADTINLHSGTFKLTITGAKEDQCATGDLDIRSSLTIQGSSKDDTIIDGNQIDRVFHIKGKNDVSFQDISITNGKSPDGEGFVSASTIFSNNPADFLSKTNRVHTDNFPSLELRNLEREKNVLHPAAHPEDGAPAGGILNEKANLVITCCFITGNKSGSGSDTDGHSGEGGMGGGIYNYEGTITINDSTINGNTAGNSGSNECYRSGGSGGGLYNARGTVSLNLCTISGNHTGWGSTCTGFFWASGDGGGIYNSGTLNIDYCRIVSNTTSLGGSGAGIYNFGDMNINHSLIKDNKAGGYAGHCGGSGGGITNCSSSIIYNSLISGNIAGESGESGCGNGGGIWNFGYLTIVNCTLTANQTSVDDYPVMGSGGGIYNTSYITIESCTIARNKACEGAGGVYSEWGDGIFTEQAVTEIHNSIIADNDLISSWNRVANDTGGEITSKGYNLVENFNSGTTFLGDESTNIYHEDPNLDHIADNGGPTRTMALKTGSVCIDAGDPIKYENKDQRGYPRPCDGDNDGNSISDIGAYEVFIIANPFLDITSPAAAAKVCGTIDITVNTNLFNVDFFIDGFLVHSDTASPFTYSWDSRSVAIGKHKIKAKGYVIPGSYAASGQVEVSVSNTVISLEVTLFKESSWIIKNRYYGKVAFAVSESSCSQPVIYSIERKEEDGSYITVKDVSTAELQAGSYIYYDLLPAKNVTYTYRVKALTSSGETIAMSEEKALSGV